MSLIAKLVNKTFAFTERVNPAFTFKRNFYEHVKSDEAIDNIERTCYGTEPYSYAREELRNPFYWEIQD
jgi:hypothetical protein